MERSWQFWGWRNAGVEVWHSGRVTVAARQLLQGELQREGWQDDDVLLPTTCKLSVLLY